MLAVRPDYTNARWVPVFALIVNNQTDLAIPELEKTVAMMNRSPGSLEMLATAYAHAGRCKDALSLINELKQRRRKAMFRLALSLTLTWHLATTTRHSSGARRLTRNSRPSCNRSRYILCSIPCAATLVSKTCSTESALINRAAPEHGQVGRGSGVRKEPPYASVVEPNDERDRMEQESSARDL